MEVYGFDESKNKVEVPSKTKTGDLTQLETTNKNDIVSAINEVFQFANDGKSTLAAAIGNGATASMTWEQLAGKVPKGKKEAKMVYAESVQFKLYNHLKMFGLYGSTYSGYQYIVIYAPDERGSEYGIFRYDVLGKVDENTTTHKYEVNGNTLTAYLKDTSSRNQVQWYLYQVGCD